MPGDDLPVGLLDLFPPDFDAAVARAERSGEADARFHEAFLAVRAPGQRAARGVYVTPRSAAVWLVRSADALLRREFGLHGLDDPALTILDPALGLGMFLREALTLATDPAALAPRVVGLEIHPAACAAAHLALGFHLLDLRAPLPPGGRLRLHVANALDDPAALPIPAAGPLLILGNPPYAGHSSNAGAWIDGRLRAYTHPDGMALREANRKWLNDDYVKFFLAAQEWIERAGAGVLAFLTSHGYLENPTFRGMRASLLRTFDALYLLDLHGNRKQRRRLPDGAEDENIFAIQSGVALGLYVRRPHRAGGTVSFAERWGSPPGQAGMAGGAYHRRHTLDTRHPGAACLRLHPARRLAVRRIRARLAAGAGDAGAFAGRAHQARPAGGRFHR